MARVYTFDDGEIVEIADRNRFSLFLPLGDPEMWTLKQWRDWFVSRGINAVLAHVVGKGYAVYRNGMLTTEERLARVKK